MIVYNKRSGAVCDKWDVWVSIENESGGFSADILSSPKES